MTAHAIVVSTGLVLGAALVALWSLQQHQRGRAGRARVTVAVLVLMAATGTVMGDDADRDQSTRLIDLGPIIPPPMWQVRTGDHFWRIADATLASQGRPPTDDEIEPYWRTLIAFNQLTRDEPMDPDVLLVGELVWLPEPD